MEYMVLAKESFRCQFVRWIERMFILPVCPDSMVSHLVGQKDGKVISISIFLGQRVWEVMEIDVKQHRGELRESDDLGLSPYLWEL